MAKSKITENEIRIQKLLFDHNKRLKCIVGIILFRNPGFCWKPRVSGSFCGNPMKFLIWRGVSVG